LLTLGRTRAVVIGDSQAARAREAAQGTRSRACQLFLQQKWLQE
jgi:hypothetical protein